MSETWVIVAEDEEGCERVVRSYYASAAEAAAARAELERNEYWDRFNLIVCKRPPR